MSVDPKKIIEAAKGSGNKVRFTLTISPDILENFKEACDREGVMYSSIVEELIKDFLESSKKKK